MKKTKDDKHQYDFTAHEFKSVKKAKRFIKKKVEENKWE